MKKIILLIFLSISASSCKKKHYEYYSDGNKKMEIELNNKDQRNGYSKEFYPNGKIKSCFIFKNNELNGEALGYFDNGNIKWTAHYHNDLPDGESKEFFISGKLLQVGFFKNGKQDSLTTEYFESGKKKTEQMWKNGIKDGVFHSYFENGVLEMTALYENDHSIFYNEFDESENLISSFRQIIVKNDSMLIKDDEISFPINLSGSIERNRKDKFFIQVSSEEGKFKKQVFEWRGNIIYFHSGKFGYKKHDRIILEYYFNNNLCEKCTVKIDY